MFWCHQKEQRCQSECTIPLWGSICFRCHKCQLDYVCDNCYVRYHINCEPDREPIDNGVGAAKEDYLVSGPLQIRPLVAIFLEYADGIYIDHKRSVRLTDGRSYSVTADILAVSAKNEIYTRG